MVINVATAINAHTLLFVAIAAGVAIAQQTLP